jgi:FlaA1/EpsC-like NDP-sugar epimerase
VNWLIMSGHTTTGVAGLRSVIDWMPRGAKKWTLAGLDMSIAFACVFLAVFNRMGWEFFWGKGRRELLEDTAIMGACAALCVGLVMWTLGLYREVTRHVGPRFTMRLVQAVFIVCMMLFAVLAFMPKQGEGFPRSAVITGCAFMLVSMGALRIGVRSLLTVGFRAEPRNVAIFGAGDEGVGLAATISRDRSLRLVAFFDDHPGLVGQQVRGVPVHHPNALGDVVARDRIEQLVMSLPPSARASTRGILDLASRLGVRVLTVPTFEEISDGRVRIDQLRPLQIEDLLGRDSVQPDELLLHRDVQGKRVLVTGAGGSIGSELCRQIMRLGPSKLILVDSCEFNLFQIDAEVRRLAGASAPGSGPDSVITCLASVTDGVRIDRIFEAHLPETVYHAAAYKHVPLVEANEPEGAETNVLGTLNVAEAAQRHRTHRMVLVSTDKAVRPANVMGATKRLAELVLQSMQARQSETGGRTIFTSVRFGNVLGSSGSVVPIFRTQIDQGGPVTVTHPDVTRYFMTIPEAVQLILQAGAMAEGGEVYVLDMGDPIRIDDLARKMIRLAGHSVRDQHDPNGTIAISYTGLRPGEKMFEELIIGTDLARTAHPGVLRAMEPSMDWDRLAPQIARLESAIGQYDSDGVRKVLCQSVREFRPSPVHR